ncbi:MULTISPECIES: RNA polymerase sigma factor [unclassified Sphingobacterium]|uniref:RNA polymerase sigma factor n=1 Tax=unclassified Sphingobacterium TaxID=2609468 RepID=UPI0010531571|nr:MULTISPECIES: sigma-70 family RNA polymerase sigma factor [unclassified Sphingobacterium]MCS3553539.1 RNA polymerase sigma-70 factor (ECF subfamily) [Sphingobacterium sp. JUb21]TCR09251.1 RNA polymerase sigma-70 factor (ECF subfamily) [Sphingobacterium sp. JUb20]
MKQSSIIESLRQENEDGLIAIYRLYNRSLIFFARKYCSSVQEAEEVVSEAFLKFWERRSQFEQVDKIRSFLYVVVKNLCLNRNRKSRFILQIDDISDYEEVLVEDSDIFLQIVRTELLTLIFEEVNLLPEKQKMIFQMSFMEDLTIEQISAKLLMTPNAVYANKSRALATLRRKLDLKNSCVFLLIFKDLF